MTSGWPVEVTGHGLRPGHGLLQLRPVHELRPAEAVAAVAVAGLPLAREHKKRLGILVLQAPGIEIVVLGNVHAELVAWVRVQRVLHLRDGLPDRFLVAGQHGLLDQLEVLGLEHVAMGERQPVDRVVGRLGPVDQLVDHIAADLEGQDRGHHARVVGEIGVASPLADKTAEPLAADRPGGQGRNVVREQGHFFTSASPQSKSISFRTPMSDISECSPL